MPGERMCAGERVLPVRRKKDLILDKVKLNRVTLISADTGSGKSSQVPQMLLEENMVPILCTQPRRLAVVAVAKRVAHELGSALGQEVGYHIGQLNVSTTKSKIVFVTAGILLEELRVNGMAALARYKVVVLDEVHERSVESDLVLTCVKQLMLRNAKIRLVLMSATADFKRYEEYFSELGIENRVERISIPNHATALQSQLLQTKVKYLENVVEQLGKRPEHVAVMENMLSNPSPAVHATDMGVATISFIRDLIVDYHTKEPDVSKSVLVFLPTYRSLEQQWLILHSAKSSFHLFVLHSSIDIEHSLKAMEAACKKRRKVILATNVAESSVTIPGVSFVVDSCRSLEVYWNGVQKHDASRLVWISQSQAEQRKGRTGRTCDGTVIRMVTRNVYQDFPRCETPQMQLFSLRKQVLMITSAESKAINDPILLLQKCMNPPLPTTVTDAIATLEELQALMVSPDKGRHTYHPTKYGQLLVSLPLSLESAIFVIHGGIAGYLRECVIIGAIMDTTPFPILQPFGEPFQYRKNLAGYYQDSSTENTGQHPPRNLVLLSNLCAYEFWQRTFRDKQRLEVLEGRMKDVKEKPEKFHKVEWGSLEDEESEQDWCNRHNLSLSGLHAVAETADIIMEKMHHYRPEFLCENFSPPEYYTAKNVSHNCAGNSKSWGPKVSFLLDNDSDIVENDETITCGEGPFVLSGTYHSNEHEKELRSLILKMRGRHLSSSSLDPEESIGSTSTSPPQCSYFRQGLCTRGANCPFSHSVSAKPMACRFYLSFSGCRYGNECRFSHDGVQENDYFSDNGPVRFEELEEASSQKYIDFISTCRGSLENIPQIGKSKVLLLGEGDFAFAEGLAGMIEPSRIIATSFDREQDALSKMPFLGMRLHRLSFLNVQVGWGIDATNLMALCEGRKAPRKELLPPNLRWDAVGCIIWNFPFLGIDEDLENHKLLMRNFFLSVAVTLFMKAQEDVLIMITLCNDQYGRWQVERAARESFFFLKYSIPFNTHAFGSYRPVRNNLEVFHCDGYAVCMFNIAEAATSNQ